jgi:hypothetical protein
MLLIQRMRFSTSASAIAPVTQAEETQEEGIELTDDQRATSLMDLTADHQRAFQSELTLYNIDVAAYDKEMKAHRELKEWIIKTVDPEYTEHTCQPEKTVRDWYVKLKTLLGPTDATLESRRAHSDQLFQASPPRRTLRRRSLLFTPVVDNDGVEEVGDGKGSARLYTPLVWTQLRWHHRRTREGHGIVGD